MNFFKRYDLFWQYPVKTEYAFYEQVKDKKDLFYIGLPWATMIDKKFNLEKIIKITREYIRFKGNKSKEIKDKGRITCCQHIMFRNIIPVLDLCNIRTLYTPHKLFGEDRIGNVEIKPCPLFAVNIEDSKRNREFNNLTMNDMIRRERPFIYSFVGSYNRSYPCDNRDRILKMNHPRMTFIHNTKDWHFNSIVYNDMQNTEGTENISNSHISNTRMYNNVLLNSRYSLCPSGTGPNSIRFWESLAVGCIPVLLSDYLELPEHPLWDESIITIKDEDIDKIPEILLGLTDIEREREMRKNCIIIYNYFKNNYMNESQR